MSGRILVIEDEANIADFIRHGLVLQGFDVKVAKSGLEGLELAGSYNPDLVVLDLMLPDVDGIDICRELRIFDKSLAIIILTARTQLGERVRGLEAGADDYLSKPFAFEELLARIRAVLRRRGITTQGIIRVADLEINLDRREVKRGSRSVDLTPREFELVKLLAQHAGKPLRREFILESVWGYDFEGESDPVKVYINFLRRKLNAAGEVDIIHAVRGFGYILRKEQEKESA